MSLKVIGAGLGRTGTHSLKVGLERLLGAPCYHMMEVFQHPEHVPVWQAGVDSKPVDWEKLMEGYAAAVDWPAAAFWPELSQAFPDALIVLSVRDSAEAWWNSAHETIFSAIPLAGLKEEMSEWFDMVMSMMAARFTSALDDREACMSAYESWNRKAMKSIPSERLLVWNAKEGWASLCERLDLPIPAEPFPRSNTKEEFLARIADRERSGAPGAIPATK